MSSHRSFLPRWLKGEFVRTGITEHRVAAVRLGEQGVLGADNSETCRDFNRRAHLEIHKIGQEHTATPAAVITLADTLKSGDTVSINNNEAKLGTEEFQLLNPKSAPGSYITLGK